MNGEQQGGSEGEGEGDDNRSEDGSEDQVSSINSGDRQRIRAVIEASGGLAAAREELAAAFDSSSSEQVLSFRGFPARARRGWQPCFARVGVPGILPMLSGSTLRPPRPDRYLLT